MLVSVKANYWTGQECNSFERRICRAHRHPYAVALANGSGRAPSSRCTARDRPRRRRGRPARSFMATASCVVRVSRAPFLRMSMRIPATSRTTAAASITPRTRAIIAVHLAGWPCAWTRCSTRRARGIRIIEDCAQSHGATDRVAHDGVDGRVPLSPRSARTRSWTTGAKAACSFNRRRAIWERAFRTKTTAELRTRFSTAITRPDFAGCTIRSAPTGADRNAGRDRRRQLLKLPAWLAARRRNARILDAELREVGGLVLRPQPRGHGHAYYKYYAFVEPAALDPTWTRERVIEAINAEGIPCISGSCSEMYLEKAYVDAGLAPASRLAVARD